MSATFGNKIKVTLFGRSHAPEIGAVVEGLPAGMKISEERLSDFMERRRAKSALATARKEADKVIFESGVADGITDGSPVRLVIKNTNVRSQDYKDISYVVRPSHADFSAFVKYAGQYDPRGGGQFSGRLTAAMCAAGFLCLEMLKGKGIEVVSHVSRVGDVEDEKLNALIADKELNAKLTSCDFPVISEEAKDKMTQCILGAKAEGDSVGGEIECAVYNLPAGLGGDFFGGLEALIASAIFSIPAVKGIEFGAGFEFAQMYGSQANDGFIIDESGKIITETNNCGGILGGISSGMPLIFKTAFKPTPSIAKPQKSVDIKEKKEVVLEIKGRHDPCIVPRAAAVIEAVTAIALVNADGFCI